MSNPFVRRSRGVAEGALTEPQIRRFQQILLDQGFVDTGRFTEATGTIAMGMRTALERYQRARGLRETGALDAETQDRLDREPGAPPPVAAPAPATAPPATTPSTAPPATTPSTAPPATRPDTIVKTVREVAPAPPGLAALSPGTKLALGVGVAVAVVGLVAVVAIAARPAPRQNPARRRRSR